MLLKSILFLSEASDVGLRFVTLQLETIRVELIMNVSFVNEKGGHSKLGFFICLVGT